MGGRPGYPISELAELSVFMGLRRSGGGSDQSRQFDEIVGGHRPNELEVELFDPTEHGPCLLYTSDAADE